MKVCCFFTLALVTISSGAAAAREVEPKLDCSRYERLADGSWRGKPGAVILLHGSRIDLSGSVLRRGGTRVDGVDVSIMLDGQCVSPKPSKNAPRS